MMTPQDRRFQKASLQAQDQLIEAELAQFQHMLAQVWQAVELPPQVRQALSCIHAHLFEETLNVAFVCATCGLGDHNVSIYFKRFVGTGMRLYIEDKRMEAAKRLLRHRQLSIQRIAWAVGYAHPESFDRSFRRCTGCSPCQYRERG